jgi:hypothetical protein
MINVSGPLSLRLSYDAKWPRTLITRGNRATDLNVGASP